LQKKKELEKASQFPEWTTTSKLMSYTDNAIFTHCMPIDRGNEVVEEVASGPHSVVYNVAENRLHVQKAVLFLTLGNLDNQF
jgi:ornithine carbamoyltransferase